jgi:sarcosine oxidase subunit alpha
MTSLEFEGVPVPVHEGDTIASALFRDGVRTFTRSLKYHRRRGLYCLTGDCANCLVTVDGEPGVRACCATAEEGQQVMRGSGFPSADHDVLAVTDRLHKVMPVGFYYKTFTRPRFAWPLAERIIRRATGVGSLPLSRHPQIKPTRHVHCDTLVIGGGVAGLAAAQTAVAAGERVVLVDEGDFGAKLPDGATRQRIASMVSELRATAQVELFERHTAVGVYDGPLVPVAGPQELLQVSPGRVIVATGAVEAHPVFPGNDLPGVWLGRGAARLAGAHGIAPGRRIVMVIQIEEALEHLDVLRGIGVSVAEVVAPDALADHIPAGIPVSRDGRVIRTEGKGAVSAVVLGTRQGQRTIACDGLVLSVGYAPRDGLLRMGADLPIAGAGDVVLPGCDPAEAEASGRRAAQGHDDEAVEPPTQPMGAGGYVCLCEDVGVSELETAWDEGWTNSEILKRYTTATMGPCQGSLCGRHLASFARQHGGSAPAGARTTSRPPARTVKLEDLAGGINEVIEKRTGLHDAHLAAGAVLDWSGSWKRPYGYGDVREEYRAVRERVSVMDVGTLGKFLIAGDGAAELVERVFPCHTANLEPGRSRYVLALDEAGYVMDDGLLCAREGGGFYLTSTSGGADRMEGWLRNWADRWGLHVHLANQTAMLGAINVAGPRARDLLQRLSDDDVSAAALPHGAHGEVSVAGVECRAIRAAFVGEVSFELHHPRSRGVALWDALIGAGTDLGVRPHGLDALDVLRLEKGHIYLGQDTLPDDHPFKLGLSWCVGMDKPAFLGKAALERMAAFPTERKLVGLRFDAAPQRGAPMSIGGRIVGRVTSCARSNVLGTWIGLGWIRAVEGMFADHFECGSTRATVVPTPFYDPEGARLRA